MGRGSSYFSPSETRTDIRKERESKLEADAIKARKFLPRNEISVVDTCEIETLRNDIFWLSPGTEVKLLRDLLYIFQGVVGAHIRYDTRSESYVLDPSLGLSCPAKDIVLCLCELGWLYAKVDAYINKTENASSRGLIAQAFGFALQEELSDYYRLLAVLESELIRTTKDVEEGKEEKKLGRAWGGEELEEERFDSSSGLTLLRLRAWMSEPIERMALMARLVEGVGALSGGALASRLHGHSMHGDQSISSMISRMMNTVCTPLYSMINRWILHGELTDGNKEFFIGYRMGVSAASMWHETYFIRTPMLPSFLSPQLAQTILVVGKSINFLRACYQRIMGRPSVSTKTTVKTVLNEAEKEEKEEEAGGERVIRNRKSPQKSRGIPMAPPSMANALGAENEKEMTGNTRHWEGILSKKEEADGLFAVNNSVAGNRDNGSSWSPFSLSEVAEMESSLQALRYGGELRLIEIVERVSKQVDQKLLNLMMSEFYLHDHLLALKKFILMGQGDFVTCLMDEIGPELKKRASQLFRHNLSGILEGALRASNAQFEPSYVLDRIGVRLLEATPGDTGWEVFSLDYAVDAPLTAVVHSEAINKYRVAFHMLWRLKRVEWTLSSSWKQLMCFTHTRGSDALPSLRPLLHRCTLYRARMTHVVNNLCGFLMFEVVETAWSTLQEKLTSATCLDDVIKAHDSYLEEIEDRSLLTTRHEALNLKIQELIQSILRFCNLEETLIADAMASIARKRAMRESIDRRTATGDWGVDTSIEELSTTGTVDGVPEYVITRLEESAMEYSRQFDGLMSMLLEQVYIYIYMYIYIYVVFTLIE